MRRWYVFNVQVCENYVVLLKQPLTSLISPSLLIVSEEVDAWLGSEGVCWHRSLFRFSSLNQLGNVQASRYAIFTSSARDLSSNLFGWLKRLSARTPVSARNRRQALETHRRAPLLQQLRMETIKHQFPRLGLKQHLYFLLKPQIEINLIALFSRY